MVKVGKDIYITKSEFKGQNYVSIRRYYEDDNGELKPGKKGISMKENEWNEFVEKFNDILKQITE